MDPDKNPVPNSFDDFLNPQVETSDNEKKEADTLEKRFDKERKEWLAKIGEMAQKLKKGGWIDNSAELMTSVYTERQRALEYYHYLISLLIKINQNYRKQYAAKYEFYSYKSQKRFPNETTKNNQILSELSEIVEKRDKMDNHSKFIDGTVKTIDNIIFGIKTRTDLEQMARGK